jgi:membrane protease YdiL (CAAX protease family)
MTNALNFAAIALAMLTLFSSVALWNRARARHRLGKPILHPEPVSPVPWGLFDIFVALLLQAVTLIAAAQWLQAQTGIDLARPRAEMSVDQRAQLMLASAVAHFGAILLTLLWLVVRHGANARELGIEIGRLRSDTLVGSAAFAMLAPIVYGLQALLVQLVKSAHPLLELLKENPQPEFFIITGVAAVLIAPVSEEILFRMLLQGWLDRAARGADSPRAVFFGGRPLPVVSDNSTRTVDEVPPASTPADEPALDGSEFAVAPPVEPAADAERRPWWPVVVSALLFALAHAEHGPDPIPLFVLAVGLGYLYRQTGRILPCIVVHMLLNCCTLLMMWLNVTQPK